MRNLLQDLRYAFRQLRKNPGFGSAAIFILALGIGGTSAIFSVLNPILFEPLPYPNANRIMTIWYSGSDGERVPQAFHSYREVAERNHSFEALAVMKPWQPALSSGNQPERLDGQRVSAEYFRVLGVPLALGRDFQPADDVLNGPKVVILSDGLWRRRFAGDARIIGQQIRLDDRPYTVVGVMPPSFENVLYPSAEAWAPLQYDSANVSSKQSREWGHHLRMIGRLRSGVRLDRARGDLAWIASTPVDEFPRPSYVSLAKGFTTNLLQDDVTRGVKPALLAVFGAVILVLLIACVNVTNLVLARSAQRQAEIAMRVALGASPRRVGRQLVTESLLLAVLGGIVGQFVTQFGIRLLLALSPSGLPRINAIRLNGTVFLFAFAVTLIVGCVVGLIPFWQVSRSDLQPSLQEGSQRVAGSHQWIRLSFVVAEVSLTLLLLVTTGLLFHSVRRLLAVPPGFEASNVISLQVQTNGFRYEDARVCNQFFAQALEAVHQVPGVTSAAFTSQLPLSGDVDSYGAQFEGDDPEIAYPVYRYAVSAEYFNTLHIPLRRGRLLDTHDTENTPPVVLISESLAKRRFPNQDPAGKRLHIGGRNGTPEFTIVGVVGDVKQMSLELNDSDAVYTTTTQWNLADRTLSLVVHGRGDVSALVPALKNAIWSVDNDQPIVRISRMDTLLAQSAAERRFVLILFEAFGLVALALAASGIYGVLAGSVVERTREIGVRSALGASRSSILALVFRQGMTLTGIGALLGFTGALLVSRAIATMLFNVSRFDPLTYLTAVALLAGVAAMACLIPAWRASRIDPMAALRYE
ncbi:MAG TPA: ABC transporter permease [Candidatus Sulfotelmatobacter sp.]|nr:ABC transporter permease [Candidatus Sulfotelmatobacter sp.]